VQVIYRAPGSPAPPGSPVPPDPPDAAAAADAELLAGLYAYPADLAGQAWVRANMVASADGAAELAGRSGGLGGPADRQLFQLLRALADVVVVGAGTARAEGYGPARPAAALPAGLAGRLRAGRPAAPPVAVISASLDLDPDSRLVAGAGPDSRTIVLTTETAPAARRAALSRRAEVITAGREQVSARDAVTALAGRGYRRILTEGGPRLLAQIAAGGLLDDLCLTISPVLAGGSARRILASPGLASPDLASPDLASPDPASPDPASTHPAGPGPGAAELPAALRLAHVVTADDGFLLCRYLRRPAEQPR
jgi:riboflavin biosynthesis pyrimidine reductase